MITQSIIARMSKRAKFNLFFMIWLIGMRETVKSRCFKAFVKIDKLHAGGNI